MSERVLIYGSRTWRDYCSIRAFVAMLPPGTIVVHGAQKSWDPETKTHYGADYFADRAAREFGLEVEPHPAKWGQYGNRAGPIRNQEMADSRPDRAQGFRSAGESRGTDDMTRCLVAAGIPHAVEIEDAGPLVQRRPGRGDR
jgi:hypothetical protein